MKKVCITLLTVLLSAGVANARKGLGTVQTGESRQFFAKKWLDENATSEQKKLIVHMRIKLSEEKTFELKGHDLTIFNTFPTDVKEYLINTFGNICGDDIRNCANLCPCYKKPVGMHRYLFQPTQEQIENFNNDEYWQEYKTQ